MYTFHSHTVVLLSSRFQYPDRRLFFSRARLFFDRIELSGWHLGKKHTRHILLADVDKIEWEGDTSAAVLHLAGGEQVTLRLSEPDDWKYSLEQRLTWNTTHYAAATPKPVNTTTTGAPSLHELITFSTCMG